MITVWVDEVDDNMGESVTTAHGHLEDGRAVTFAGDWRPMRDLARALVYIGQEIEVEVERWQLLHVTPRPPTGMIFWSTAQ